MTKKGRDLVDLDEVLLTPEVYAAWQEVARVAGLALKSLGVSPEEIPEEEARVEPDGSLTIFVALPRGYEVALRVPPAHWAWRQ